MTKPITNLKIPDTDSIAELAQFWQDHDLTDFEDQLEEVTETVFGIGNKRRSCRGHNLTTDFTDFTD